MQWAVTDLAPTPGGGRTPPGVFVFVMFLQPPKIAKIPRQISVGIRAEEVLSHAANVTPRRRDRIGVTQQRINDLPHRRTLRWNAPRLGADVSKAT